MSETYTSPNGHPGSLSTGPDGEPDPAPGLIPCPRCTDAVVDLDEHLSWCREGEPDPQEEAVEQAARIAAAYTLIEEDRQRRSAACLAEIEAALERHGMTMHIEPARLTLVPKD